MTSTQYFFILTLLKDASSKIFCCNLISFKLSTRSLAFEFVKHKYHIFNCCNQNKNNQKEKINKLIWPTRIQDLSRSQNKKKGWEFCTQYGLFCCCRLSSGPWKDHLLSSHHFHYKPRKNPLFLFFLNHSFHARFLWRKLHRHGSLNSSFSGSFFGFVLLLYTF